MTKHAPLPAFVHAEQTAQQWLATVASHLGTTDSPFAYRLLRTWLHMVRDRLRVHDAAHLAAQLPELLRGVYYEGWTPSAVPVKLSGTEYANQFARGARISLSDVPRTASAVTAAMTELCSPGMIDSVLARFPAHLRILLRPASAVAG